MLPELSSAAKAAPALQHLVTFQLPNLFNKVFAEQDVRMLTVSEALHALTKKLEVNTQYNSTVSRPTNSCATFEI